MPLRESCDDPQDDRRMGMRVLAVAFEDAGAATQALEELQRRYALGPDDASVAPLGAVDGPGPSAVLAGRFDDDEVADVRALLAERGGEVVSEVDERWTHSPVVHDQLERDGHGNGLTN